MPLDITVVILTFNESLHLRRCLESLAGWVARIVIIDSFSSDDTHAIAKDFNADFYQNRWVNYATQFQWGLDNAQIKTEWVFRIDADEFVENELKNEISQALSVVKSDISGFYVRRKYVFLGQWIRFGAMYPIHVLRLWRNQSGRIEQRWMDEHIVLTNGSALSLKGNIVDDNLNNVGWWINKHNGYATREMLDLLNKKYGFLPEDHSMDQQQSTQAKTKRWLKTALYSKLPYFIRPLMYFLYRYIFRLGFLDGIKGFAFHFMQGLWYRCLVDLKMLEAEIWLNGERNPDVIKAILKSKTGLSL